MLPDPGIPITRHDPPDEHIIKQTIERGRREGVRLDERTTFRGKVINTWKQFTVSSRVSLFESKQYRGDLIELLDNNAVSKVLTDFPFLKYLTIVKVVITSNMRPDMMDEEHVHRFVFSSAELEKLSEDKPHIFI